MCMGGHLPGGGRDRGVQGSPTKHSSLPPMPCSTFTTSGLVRCVRLGRLLREGSAPLVRGWTFLCFALASATLCACCAAGCVNCRGWACSCWRAPRFSILPHPISRSLSWFSSFGQRPPPPHPLSTLVLGLDVAVDAWLAFLHGETPLPVLGPAQPPLPATGSRPCRSSCGRMNSDFLNRIN